MPEWEGDGGYSDDHYDIEGLSVSIRIQERACEHLEIVAYPKGGRNIKLRCEFCENPIRGNWLCPVLDRTNIICPLDEYGRLKPKPINLEEINECAIEEIRNEQRANLKRQCRVYEKSSP